MDAPFPHAVSIKIGYAYAIDYAIETNFLELTSIIQNFS